MTIPISQLIGLAPGVLKLVNTLVEKAEQDGLIDAGKAQAFRDAVKGIDDDITSAIAAGRAVSHDPRSVRNDPNNRDNISE